MSVVVRVLKRLAVFGLTTGSYQAHRWTKDPDLNVRLWWFKWRERIFRTPHLHSQIWNFLKICLSSIKPTPSLSAVVAHPWPFVSLARTHSTWRRISCDNFSPQPSAASISMQLLFLFRSMMFFTKSLPCKTINHARSGVSSWSFLVQFGSWFAPLRGKNLLGFRLVKTSFADQWELSTVYGLVPNCAWVLGPISHSFRVWFSSSSMHPKHSVLDLPLWGLTLRWTCCCFYVPGPVFDLIQPKVAASRGGACWLSLVYFGSVPSVNWWVGGSCRSCVATSVFESYIGR